jgi:hypothetical protein
MICMLRLAPMSRAHAINAASLLCLDLVLSSAHPSHSRTHTRQEHYTHAHTHTYAPCQPRTSTWCTNTGRHHHDQHGLLLTIGSTGRRTRQRKNDKRIRRCCAIRSKHARRGLWRGYGAGECWSARGESSRTARARCSMKRWLTEHARERTKGTKQKRGLACSCP